MISDKLKYKRRVAKFNTNKLLAGLNINVNVGLTLD